MKVSVKDGNDCEKILTIEVSGDEILKEYDEFYRALAPTAKIPGFRPGKAPRSVLAMRFKGEAREKVLKNLISETCRLALREKSIEPLSYPQIEDVNFKEEGPLSYKARIEVRPKIRLAKISGLKAARETAEVKPEEVEASLKRVQESLAKFKAVEDRPVRMGDSMIADYVCFAGGKEIEKKTGDWFEIREEEYLKGFSAQLMGAKAGEEREVKVTFPADAQRRDLAGQEAVFKLTVKEIKTKVLPALDDEMAKEAGEFKTLAELRGRIEKNLREAKEHEKEAAFEKALLDELVKQNKIDLPEGLVARRLEQLVRSALENDGRRGLPREKLEELEKSIRAGLPAEARRQVHLAFLLDEIAAKENLTASEEDLKEKYRSLAARLRQPEGDVEKLYAQNEEAREALRDQIRNEKAIEFLKKNSAG